MQIHLAYECKDVNIKVKNKYILMIAKKDDLNNNMKVKVFEANMNDKNDKNNKLPIEQVVLIDCLVLKVFVICKILFQVIENLYFINLLKNL